jgi:hypothetical protein
MDADTYDIYYRYCINPEQIFSLKAKKFIKQNKQMRKRQIKETTRLVFSFSPIK